MKPRILVVEDNPDNMTLVQWALDDAGYTCVQASSAETAFRMLEFESVDLILMDISLPGIDGKEATRRLRTDPRYASIPIIAVTAHAISEEERAIRDCGVNDVITKPIDWDRFQEVLQTYLCAGASHGTNPRR
ncbi:MAG: response regulator [Pirellulales bacterium]|nr:response regulator [Pirellulales bacterium]